MTQQKDKYVFYISENGKLDRKNFKNLNGEFDGFDKESITNEYEISYDFNTNYLKCKNKFIDEHFDHSNIFGSAIIVKKNGDAPKTIDLNETIVAILSQSKENRIGFKGYQSILNKYCN
jgi:hypothetical protein